MGTSASPAPSTFGPSRATSRALPTAQALAATIRLATTCATARSRRTSARRACGPSHARGARAPSPTAPRAATTSWSTSATAPHRRTDMVSTKLHANCARPHVGARQPLTGAFKSPLTQLERREQIDAFFDPKPKALIPCNVSDAGGDLETRDTELQFDLDALRKR